MEVNEYMNALMELTEDIDDDEIAETISLSLICVCNQMGWYYELDDGVVMVYS